MFNLEGGGGEAAVGANILFRHPFTMCVSGCTGSGKTEWVQRRLLQHMDEMITAVADDDVGAAQPPAIQAVLYCYGELNAGVLRMQQMQAQGRFFTTTNTANSSAVNNQQKKQQQQRWIHVCPGCPDEQQVQAMARQTGGRLLVILDDLMVGMRQPFLDVLFTRGSHNWGSSVVLLTQHLFTRELRVARNNSHYLVLMRNPQAALQVRTLGTQLFPGRMGLRHFLEAYEDATGGQQFSYLLVDMHPATPDALRLRTHIYPEEWPMVVYQRSDGGSGGGFSSSNSNNKKRQQ